jgi:hypothetical protein
MTEAPNPRQTPEQQKKTRNLLRFAFMFSILQFGLVLYFHSIRGKVVNSLAPDPTFKAQIATLCSMALSSSMCCRGCCDDLRAPSRSDSSSAWRFTSSVP